MMDDIQLMNCLEALSETVDAALHHTHTNHLLCPPFPPHCGLPPLPQSHHLPPHDNAPPRPLHSLPPYSLPFRSNPPPPIPPSFDQNPMVALSSSEDMFSVHSQLHHHPYARGGFPPGSAEYDTSLKDFLEKLDLDEYCEAFMREEVTDVNALRHLESSDLKQIGLSLGKICKIRSALSQNGTEEVEVAPGSGVLSDRCSAPPLSQKRKRTADTPSATDKDQKWAKVSRTKSPSRQGGESANFSPDNQNSWGNQKNSRKPYAEVHEMRPIVRVRLKELWPTFDKEWKQLNGKTEDGQTIRHIPERDLKAIINSLCSQFSNPRWAWESEIKIVEKNHIDELVKQSKRKKTAEKRKKMRQECAPGDWKREVIPESVLRLESQTVSSWPRLRESLKGRKTTQIDLASSMRTSLKERRSWECPKSLERMREYMNDCPAYRRMQGFFVDICLIFERCDITWANMTYRLELTLVAVYQLLAEFDAEDLQKAVTFAATKLKCRLTTSELFASIAESGWRERYPDVLIPAWMWLLHRSEGVEMRVSMEEDFHKDGIASLVFQQMWPRLNKKNTGVLDLMLCSVCVWFLLPISPGSKNQMGVLLLEIILNQGVNAPLDPGLKDLQRLLSEKVAKLAKDPPPHPLKSGLKGQGASMMPSSSYGSTPQDPKVSPSLAHPFSSSSSRVSAPSVPPAVLSSNPGSGSNLGNTSNTSNSSSGQLPALASLSSSSSRSSSTSSSSLSGAASHPLSRSLSGAASSSSNSQQNLSAESGSPRPRNPVSSSSQTSSTGGISAPSYTSSSSSLAASLGSSSSSNSLESSAPADSLMDRIPLLSRSSLPLPSSSPLTNSLQAPEPPRPQLPSSFSGLPSMNSYSSHLMSNPFEDPTPSFDSTHLIGSAAAAGDVSMDGNSNGSSNSNNNTPKTNSRPFSTSFGNTEEDDPNIDSLMSVFSNRQPKPPQQPQYLPTITPLLPSVADDFTKLEK